ncbi:hypothetical protein EHP00_2523 [Ecytonucleospora hepatopenaei]|nr:hypothetical protein EHP00_2523 [Ecytonucleospora hepatopenaei]
MLIVDMSNMHVLNIIKDTHEIWACDVILHDNSNSIINNNNINITNSNITNNNITNNNINNIIYIVYGSTNKKCYFISYNTLTNKISHTHTISNKNIVRDISIIRENNTYVCLIANRDKTLKKYTLYGELVSIIHKNIDIRILYNNTYSNIYTYNNTYTYNNIYTYNNNILIGTYNGNIYYYNGYNIKRIHHIELGGKVIAIHYNNYDNSIYYGNDNKLYNYIAIGGKDNEILIYNIYNIYNNILNNNILNNNSILNNSNILNSNILNNNNNNILNSNIKLFNHNDTTINIYNIDRRTYIRNILNNITYNKIHNKYNINGNKAMLETYIHNDAYAIAVTLYGEVVLYCVNKHSVIYRHRIGMICKCSILYNNILYIGTERGMVIMDIESKIIDNIYNSNNLYNSSNINSNLYNNNINNSNNSIIHILEEYKILKIELNNNINNTDIDNIILIICMDINTYEIYIKRINRY